MKVGFAQIKINPPLGTPLGGQLHDGKPWGRHATGILDDLYASAMVLDDGKNQVALVACDILVFSDIVVKKARESIEKKSGIPKENTIISATHTHSGPLTADIFGGTADQKYIDFLIEKVGEVTKCAKSIMKDARIGIGIGVVQGISFNRRFIMSDGTVETHPLKGDKRIVKPEGPNDPQVGVIYAEDLEGNLLGVIVNFTCHPTCIERENQMVSSDYPGFISKTVQAVKGDNVVVLFTNGAEGNICQVDVLNLERKEVGRNWASKMGIVLGAETLKVIELTSPSPECKIGIKRKTIKIPIREVPTEELIESRRILKEEKALSRPILGDYGSENVGQTLSTEEVLHSPEYRQMWAQERILIYEIRKNSPTIDVEITALILNDCALVAIPAELFVEFGIEIKEKAKERAVFIIGLANGYVGYIPTRHAFQRVGGYETILARCPNYLVPQAGEMIVDAVLDLLDAGATNWTS